MTSKMFLDIVGVITTSKLSILKTFQGGAPGAPPPCQIGLIICDQSLSNVHVHRGRYCWWLCGDHGYIQNCAPTRGQKCSSPGHNPSFRPYHFCMTFDLEEESYICYAFWVPYEVYIKDFSKFHCFPPVLSS